MQQVVVVVVVKNFVFSSCVWHFQCLIQQLYHTLTTIKTFPFFFFFLFFFFVLYIPKRRSNLVNDDHRVIRCQTQSWRRRPQGFGPSSSLLFHFFLSSPSPPSPVSSLTRSIWPGAKPKPHVPRQDLVKKMHHGQKVTRWTGWFLWSILLQEPTRSLKWGAKEYLKKSRGSSLASRPLGWLSILSEMASSCSCFRSSCCRCKWVFVEQYNTRIHLIWQLDIYQLI